MEAQRHLAEAPRPARAPGDVHTSARRVGARPGARGGGQGGEGWHRCWRTASTPLPLPRRLTGPGHPPQPMSASRGGPWTQSLRLLRVVASAVGNQNRVGTAQVDQAAQPAPTGDAPLPRRAPHRAARDRVELQPHAPPRTLSPPPPPQHPWGTGDFKGVWGFGSREITGTERRLSLSWKRFLLRSFGRYAG